jgi:hypothetical protein
MQLVRLALSAMFVVIAACGSTRPAMEDAAPAAPDAAPSPTSSTQPFEVVSGAQRIAGGRFTMDVEIGHGFDQSSTTGGAIALDGAATIK